MASSLSNYRDVSRTDSTSLDVGFQFEFACGNCSRTWKSPFRPYRRGQFVGAVYNFVHYFGDRSGMFRWLHLMATTGETKARESALNAALQLADQRYTFCPRCNRAVCEECWDDRARACQGCRGESGRTAKAATGYRGGSEKVESVAGQAAAAKCSNCGAALDGGRFCAECGFDLASTHKSCPGCGTLCVRAARFCPDCGHGF